MPPSMALVARDLLEGGWNDEQSPLVDDAEAFATAGDGIGSAVKALNAVHPRQHLPADAGDQVAVHVGLGAVAHHDASLERLGDEAVRDFRFVSGGVHINHQRLGVRAAEAALIAEGLRFARYVGEKAFPSGNRVGIARFRERGQRQRQNHKQRKNSFEHGGHLRMNANTNPIIRRKKRESGSRFLEFVWILFAKTVQQ